MNRIAQLKEKTIVEISLFLALLFPFVPPKYASISLILFTISSIVAFVKAKNTDFKWNAIVVFGIFIFIPLLYFIQLIFANDLGFVWKIVERKLAFFIAPLAFLLISTTKINLNPITYVRFFFRTVVIFVVYCIIQISLQGFHSNYLQSGGFAFAFRTTIEEISKLHPSYFGLFIAFSMLVGMDEMFQDWRKLNKLTKAWMSFSLIVLLVFLLFLAARMALIGLLFSSVILVHKRIPSWKIKVRVLIVAITCFVVAMVLIPSISSRLNEINSTENNGTSIRTTIWSCSTDLIQENPIKGVGLENVQHKLNACYEEKNKYLATLNHDYNTHNEFLNQWASFGIIGCLALLLLLGAFFYYSKKQIIFLVFSLLVSTSLLTENLLERQMGIFFVAIFGGLFVFNFSIKHSINKS